MKVLLINPQTPNMISNKEYYIPTSMLYLAGALKNAGISVRILDLNILKPWNKKSIKGLELCERVIFETIIDFSPLLIGIGCLFSGHFPLVLNYTKKIKEQFATTPIVIGGIHPTTFPAEILANCSSVDYVVLGEGEEAIVKIASILKKKKVDTSDTIDLNNIDGIAYRLNGKVIVNPKNSFINSLDNIPFPAYDLINIKDYYHNTSGWLNPRNLSINASIPILTSRGCPTLCSFCSMFKVMGHRHRARSPEKVVDEIEFLYKKYNHRHFSFIDDNLTLKKSNILEICNQIIERNLNIQFDTPNGVAIGKLDKEVMDALVEAGLVKVTLAIESGSDYIRNKIMGKNLSRDKIMEIVRLTKQYKHLYVKAFFIIGMPEDTKTTLSETYKMIEEIDVDQPCLFNLRPFPGTRVFDQALKDKLFTDNFNIDSIWKMDTLHYSNNKIFFIKPYNMSLKGLQEFRCEFDDLIETIVNKKREERNFVHYAKLK